LKAVGAVEEALVVPAALIPESRLVIKPESSALTAKITRYFIALLLQVMRADPGSQVMVVMA